MRMVLSYGAVAIAFGRYGYWRAEREGRGVLGHKPINSEPSNLPDPSPEQIHAEGMSRFNIR